MSDARRAGRPATVAPAAELDVATIRLHGVGREHAEGALPVRVLDCVDLEVPRGQLVSIVGHSGAGKSTLLRIVAGIDPPSEGRVVLLGRDLGRLSEDERSDLRLRRVGLVFQASHLLPGRTVLENVAWPLEFGGAPWREAVGRALAALDRVGIARRLVARAPWSLSGGERQRVAIARAIAGRPEIILADEPTGRLDSRSAGEILDLLGSLAGPRGATVLVATHDVACAARGDRTVELRDGRLVRDVVAAPRPRVASLRVVR